MTTNKTLTDEQGNTYKVVSSKWMTALTVIAIVNFVILMACIAFIIDNSRSIDSTLTFTDKAAQRNAAVNDIASSRAIANIWTYKEACDYAKKQGRDCLENPTWYADPKKYPLIVNDVMGAGLFPPTQNPQGDR